MYLSFVIKLKKGFLKERGNCIRFCNLILHDHTTIADMQIAKVAGCSAT